MPRTTSRLAVPTCPFCHGPAPRRYPGNDPECGPAVPTCKSTECAATLKASEARDIADGVAVASILLMTCPTDAVGKHAVRHARFAIDRAISLAPRFKRPDVAIGIEETVFANAGLSPWEE